MTKIKGFLQNQKGANGVEYGILIAFLAFFTFFAVFLVFNTTSNAYNGSSVVVENVVETITTPSSVSTPSDGSGTPGDGASSPNCGPNNNPIFCWLCANIPFLPFCNN